MDITYCFSTENLQRLFCQLGEGDTLDIYYEEKKGLILCGSYDLRTPCYVSDICMKELSEVYYEGKTLRIYSSEEEEKKEVFCEIKDLFQFHENYMKWYEEWHYRKHYKEPSLYEAYQIQLSLKRAPYLYLYVSKVPIEYTVTRGNVTKLIV